MPKIQQTNLPIYIGARCNYSCQHCASGSDLRKNLDPDPSLEEIISAIPILAEKFEVNGSISLLGGEPLLYWDEKIVPLTAKLREHFPDSRINIYTNGHLIGKNISRILDIMIKHNISLTISRHLMGDITSVVGRQWQKSIDQLISHPSIVKIHNDHFHIKDNIRANIHFYSTKFWSSHYYTLPNGQIKPHATNDPKNSMRHGCTGNVCSYLYGTKLYKCGRLANLQYLLQSVDQSEDPDWKKYLDYQPLDLLNLKQTDLDHFLSTYGKAIPECDMCQATPSDLLWKDRTWDLVFQQKHTP
jgi:organic radical activating enzyme